MNTRIQELANKSGATTLSTKGHEMVVDGCYIVSPNKLQKFAELIVEEHLALLQQEWYALNDAPEVENESPRDVGFRVGKKSEINVLMAKIRDHFGVKE